MLSSVRPKFRPAGSGGGGAASLTWTYRDSQAIAGSGIASPINFTGLNIGTASSDRIVVACFVNSGAALSANEGLSAVTIGGVSATKAVATDPTAQQRMVEIWFAAVPTGTTANVSATVTGGSGWMNNSEVFVGTLTGSVTASVASTVTGAQYPNGFTNSNSAAVTVPSGGVAIMGAFADNDTASSSWTNAVKDAEIANSTAYIGTIAHATASATVTENVSGNTGVGSGWLGAVFQP